MKSASLLASFFLGLIAVGHLFRVIAGTDVMVGDWVVPMWPSILVFIVFGTLAVLVWREASRPPS
jgi:hypothetical protein